MELINIEEVPVMAYKIFFTFEIIVFVIIIAWEVYQETKNTEK